MRYDIAATVSDVCDRMVNCFQVLIASTLTNVVLSVNKPTAHDIKFDFLSEYQIVRTKILERSKGKMKINLESLQGVLLYSIILLEAGRFSSPFLDLHHYTVYNSTGTYTESFSVDYYHGHVILPVMASHVHGTMYHDLAFEGTLEFDDRKLYLEAVDRHRLWYRDQSVLYVKDDIAEFCQGEVNFPDTHLNFTHRRSVIKSTEELYKKYGIPDSHKNNVPRQRLKRSTDTNKIKYCKIHLVVDGYFTHYMANDNKQEAAKMLAQSVKNVHEIFLSHDFDGNSLPDNIGIVMSGLTFIDKVFNFNYLKAEKDSEDFLRKFTENYQFPDACAALVYTFQDFGPTLGMAWVATSERPYRTGIGAPWNHGFVTTLLKGKRVTARVAQLTLIHELGHSFGSSHDPTESGHICAPSVAQGGRYIMFPTTSEGTMPNNYEFSPCSKNVIAIIIATRSVKALRSYEAPYCGNGNVEEGEECDCGTPLSCHSLDQCCVPAGNENQCLLRRDQGVVCTPAVHDCCTQDCQVIPGSANFTCGGQDECSQEVRCDGVHVTCPVAFPVADATLCKGGTMMCEDGDCTKSICSVAGLADCMCSELSDACRLCCLNSSKAAARCRPAGEYSWFSENNYKLTEWLQPGSLCLDHTGYCGTDMLCVKPGIDYVGLLGLQIVSQNVNKWFDNNWYHLMIFIFLAVLLAFIFKCTQEVKHTPISSAFRLGNISRVIQECERQRALLNHEITRLNHSVRMFEKGQQSVTVAVARLMLVFPLTPVHYVYRVIVNSANEAGAVKKLILMKQPMIKDCTSYKAVKSQTREPLSVGKVNEQFEGVLMATINDLTQRTQNQLDGLGITVQSPAQAKKMLKEHHRRLEKGAIHAFNKPL